MESCHSRWQKIRYVGTDVKGFGGGVVIGYRYRPGGRCDLAWILLTSIDNASQCTAWRVTA